MPGAESAPPGFFNPENNGNASAKKSHSGTVPEIISYPESSFVTFCLSVFYGLYFAVVDRTFKGLYYELK
ncbi:hypothetical protein D1164_23425 [Mariniphaga sediminis]|jgi:hypothetical protein|uniref:Uncharacterized protein n=1 Tax=Mariniphaga sediminis TaxID=1628158 RepID=A0A399CSU3_9BACT|nr:hypothetical protein D1164_23425 [Mariniphaga sediminis]